MKKIGKKLIVIFLTICLVVGTFPVAYADSAQQKYMNALEKIGAGEYEQASELLDSIGSYEDSTYLNMYCKAIVEAEKGNYDIAFLTFESLGDDYRDCKLLKTYYQARKYELTAESFEYNRGEYYVSAYNVYLTIYLVKDSRERAARCIQAAYDYAVAQAAEGNYQNAIKTFNQISDYLDSRILSKKASADSEYDAGNLAGAYEIYKDLPLQYQTHAKEYEEIYNNAISKKTEGSYDAAREIFISLGSYLDSAEQAVECLKMKAESLFNEKKYDEAAAVYFLLGDSAKVTECYYLKAAEYFDNKQYEAAAEVYKSLNDSRKEKECYYQMGKDLEEQQDYINAAKAYLKCLDYSDSRELHYQMAANNLEDDVWTAFNILKDDPEYDKAKELIYQIAVNASTQQDYELSISAYKCVGYYKDAILNLMSDSYSYGNLMYDQGKYKECADFFARLGDFSNAPEKVKYATYALAKEFFDTGNYTSARYYFGSLSSYKDSHECYIESTYLLAKDELDSGNYSSAKSHFEEVKTYKDSNSLWIDCHYLIAKDLYDNEQFALALNAFEESVLKDYKDTAAFIQECCYELGKDNEKKKIYLVALEFYNRAGEIYDTLERKLNCYYEYAMEEKRVGNTDSALHYYEQSSGHKDSKDQIMFIADYYMNTEQYAEAVEAYAKIIELEPALKKIYTALERMENSEKEKYGDSESYVHYIIAENALSKGDVDTALKEFEEAGDYNDSETRIKKIHYELAETAQASGDWETAAAEFIIANDYSDAENRVLESYYKQGDAALAEGEYSMAISAFAKAGIYDDATERLMDIYYNLGESALAKGDTSAAIDAFGNAGEYKDAEERILKIHYEVAETAQASGDWETAVTEFTNAGTYKDATDRILETYYKQAEASLAEGFYNAAIEAFEMAKGYKDSAERIQKTHYEFAEKAQASGDWETAIAEFSGLGEYLDAQSRVLETFYKQGEELFNNRQFDTARLSFELAGNYSGAAEKVIECHIQSAKTILDEGRFEEAYDALISYFDYEEVRKVIQENETLNSIYLQDKRKAISKRGNTVFLGKYEQDNNSENGLEPIEWIVLNVEGDNAILISYYVLDDKQYNEKDKSVTWESCSLRKWLNSDFLNGAFNEEEQNIIVLTDVDNSAKQSKDKKVGNGKNTKDKVYMLSYSELKAFDKYVNFVKGRRTIYEKSKGAFKKDDTTPWWLRTKGEQKGNRFDVVIRRDNGFMTSAAVFKYGVRPVIQVSIDEFVKCTGLVVKPKK